MKAFVLSALLLIAASLNAQVGKDSPLYATMKAQSSELYERGFNQCDMAYLESVAHQSLSAYYEQGEAQDRAKFFSDVQTLNCSDPNKKIIRKVDPDSIEVFALDKPGVVGAVQSGRIDFYLSEPGKPEVRTSTGKFTHVWILENGKWQLREIMSFANQEIKQPN